jgi:DNA-binding NtrC family response regulator
LKNKILLIDDEPNIRWTLSELFNTSNTDTLSSDGSSDILNFIIQEKPDLIFLDLKLKTINGMDILRQINKENIVTTVIVITAYGSIDTAVEALKLGAYDYLTKPFDITKVKMIAKKALEKTQLSKEIIYLHSQLEERYNLKGIIGKSPKMQRVFEAIEKMAEVDSTVLLQGESGTGKDITARAIHFTGFRKRKPFVAVNCAAIPYDLLESELFGHERGAFTGAVSRKIGKFLAADKGTLFLDEISTLPLNTQAKLLRTVEYKQIEPLGENKKITVDVRIIASTNDNLKDLVRKGKFREDLFYRISVIPIYLPPLRHRKEDIPLLAEYFLEKYNKKYSQITPKIISKDFMSSLMKYSWPGNVRELSNYIERAIVMSEGKMLTNQDLPYKIESKGQNQYFFNSTPDFADFDIEKDNAYKNVRKSLITKYEIENITNVLEKTKGNKTKASKLLGISRRCLYFKLKKYGINYK